MSAIFDAWAELEGEEQTSAHHEQGTSDEEADTTPSGQFAEQQIQNLVEKVFLGDWPRSKHQIVFSGACEDSGSAAISFRVAVSLANQTPARVCLVETQTGVASWEQDFGGARVDGGNIPETAGVVRASSRQMKTNLWVVPSAVWKGRQKPNLPWVRRRLAEIRSEFDYAVIHAPPIGSCGDVEMLARLSDGLVLVLEAHRTRKLLARVARQKLEAANVKILGAVLSGRTFPIPESLYRRF